MELRGGRMQLHKRFLTVNQIYFALQNTAVNVIPRASEVIDKELNHFEKWILRCMQIYEKTDHHMYYQVVSKK